MSETSHTPGPWSVRPHWSDPEKFEVFPDRDTDFGEPAEVAEVSGHYADDEELAAEAEANARLIAAAPELLAVAKAALAFIDSHVADPDLTEEMVTKYNALRLLEPHDVIAKAEGQSTRRDGPVLREGA